jgi:NAD(P)H-dependent FMN reductase
MSPATSTETAPPLKVAIILGSTRPGRLGEPVAKWAFELARKRSDATFELVDLKEYQLPHLDEPIPPSAGRYAQAHTKKWAAKIGSFDAFVFVTPEYNHSTSGALKNAIDFLYKEWNNKVAGFVSYGSAGGSARSRTSGSSWRSSRWRPCAPRSPSRCSATS